uniref:Uncharacterized protein n=1 Tax=Leptobrachium leishanense TaxID=445787 RepID=A0A8C5MTR8_9ANUR
VWESQLSFIIEWLFNCTEKYQTRRAGLTEDIVKVAKDVKPLIEIQENGNTFVVTSKTPNGTHSNTFVVGEETEINIPNGKKIKVTVNLEGGKLICKSDTFYHVQEIQGSEMVETITVESITMTRKSRKI